MTHNHNLDHLDFNFSAVAPSNDDASKTYSIGYTREAGDFTALAIIDNTEGQISAEHFNNLRDELINLYHQLIPGALIEALNGDAPKDRVSEADARDEMKGRGYTSEDDWYSFITSFPPAGDGTFSGAAVGAWEEGLTA